MLDVTVVLPIHGERLTNGMGDKAIKSVLTQEMPPNALIVEVDKECLGAAEVRHRGLMKVTTEFVAFLDSDDSFYPNHLKALSEGIEAEDADFAFSHPITWGGYNPFEADFGKPWDNDNPRHTTITTLVKTELAQQVGFLNYNTPRPGVFGVSDEDMRFTLGCMDAGAKIVHCPEKTWLWSMHGRNSGGVPGQGDAPPRV
ncbi:MAG: glycosyltransferase family 2 protein [Actinobacteria bacterium]|nr:glycosyltransferase family 2 protein [Actinomycetota bacterium]